MNILVDLRALQSGNISGIEVFIEHLTKALVQIAPEVRFFLWTNSQEELPAQFPEFLGANVFRIHTRYSNIILTVFARLFSLPKIDKFVGRVAKKQKLLGKNEIFNAILVPDPRVTPVSKKAKKISIIHDLTPKHFPKSFSLKTRIWHKLVYLKQEAKTSTHIFTPSFFTKEDIRLSYHLPEEKISVIGAGVSGFMRPVDDPIELAEVRKKYQLPHEFLLTLSTLEPRKNLKNLIEGFARFQKKYDAHDFALVIAGKANPSIFAEIQLPKAPFVVFPGFIDEEDKAALFSAATGFVYPSLFEGFGLPVLEALACGTPVLSSNFTSLPEVYGDAALSFDPTETSEIAECIETLFLQRNLRKDLSQKGLKRASCPQFSWETVAKKVMVVVKELCGEQQK